MSTRTVEEVMAAYKAAAMAKDLDAFISLYDANARVFDLWEAWSYTGQVEWRKVINEWFSALGEDSVLVEMRDVQIEQESGLAAMHALVKYAAVSPEGHETHAMQNRLTWILGLRDGEWKILHEHTSAPARMESKEVMLEG